MRKPPAPSVCGTSVVRNAAPKDLDAIVTIHQRAFGEFFLTQMGSSFLRMYYQFVLNYRAGILLVGEKHGAHQRIRLRFRRPREILPIDVAQPQRLRPAGPCGSGPAPFAGGQYPAERSPDPDFGGARFAAFLRTLFHRRGARIVRQRTGQDVVASFLAESWSKLAGVRLPDNGRLGQQRANKLYCDVGFRQSRCFLQRQGRWMNEYVFHRSAADRTVEIHS